ncbi:hypothetical protein [Catenovulum adriaticum]|uniref:Uncharacterized protein n=1 Tax=Catenovulum adriaticum TaxID=2984846 RepID=A0ABY7AMR8_9ALTE|nr:hypothetical protein [Catenovulum sp. TS8]WAJ70843.1 hypothetical protein OLW01_03265 [Catenovulum sp. TS8]
MLIKAKFFLPFVIGLASVLAGSAYWYFSLGFYPTIDKITTRANSGLLQLTAAEIDWYNNLSPHEQRNFHQQLKQQTNWQAVTQLNIPQTMAQDWANQQHLISQWYLSNHSESSFERHYWLKKLANNHKADHYAAKASFKLAQMNQQSAPLVADTWYKKALSLNQDANFKFEYAKFLIEQGEPESQWAYLINNNPLAQNYTQTELVTYKYDFTQVLKALNSKVHPANYDTHALIKCRKPIQLLASNYQQLQKIQYSLQTLLDLDFFAESSFCISGHHWSKNIPTKTPEINDKRLQTTHWLIESPNLTRAYRQGQFIFMPRELNTQVLGHELAHWLGLEDEYLLNEDKARQRCALNVDQFGKKLGHNLVVIKPSYYFKSKKKLLGWMEQTVPWFDYIEQKDNWIVKEQAGYRIQYQRIGSAIGFYPVPTCNNLDLISLKPISKNTFMQNHEYYIPNLYKKIILHSGDITDH